MTPIYLILTGENEITFATTNKAECEKMCNRFNERFGNKFRVEDEKWYKLDPDTQRELKEAFDL